VNKVIRKGRGVAAPALTLTCSQDLIELLYG
jgi:hypothetical protein